jgi:hypothetical protein
MLPSDFRSGDRRVPRKKALSFEVDRLIWQTVLDWRLHADNPTLPQRQRAAIFSFRSWYPPTYSTPR